MNTVLAGPDRRISVPLPTSSTIGGPLGGTCVARGTFSISVAGAPGPPLTTVGPGPESAALLVADNSNANPATATISDLPINYLPAEPWKTAPWLLKTWKARRKLSPSLSPFWMLQLSAGPLQTQSLGDSEGSSSLRGWGSNL